MPVPRRRARNVLLVALAVVVVAGAVWAVNQRQRAEVERSFTQSSAVGGMLTAMLNQETGLRGYLNARQESFLEPYHAGRDRLTSQATMLARDAQGIDRETMTLLERSLVVAREWNQLAEEALTRAKLDRGYRTPLPNALARKELMDRFRAINAVIARRIEANRRESMRATQRMTVLLILALAAIFGGAGWYLLARPAERQRAARAREHRRRDRQGEFARTMQVMDSESEAHALVQRHLERSLPEAKVVVLQRNNSADRLEATTPLPACEPLVESLVDAEPRSCLAVRLGAQHAEVAGESLLECELCGKAGTETTVCTPLVVSGEVIGSVLVGRDRPLDETDALVIDDTVTQAAPVLANMRNLAIAEIRAATDSLTGLANRRALQDTVRRMIAQASRAQTPLAVLAIDIDHFKTINDRFGHDRGDDVLAAVAQALAGTLRASDFVGRQGGEEFVALLPDTDLSGALTAGENLRAAIEALDLLADERVTASFGIAVLPEDGVDGPSLLRQADRALYAAKANGRNRVETAASGARSPLAADIPA